VGYAVLMGIRGQFDVMTTPQLLSELDRVHLPVTRTQLKGWGQAGLIERGKKVGRGGLGGGRRGGVDFWWSEEAFPRAMLIACSLSEDRQEGRKPSLLRAARVLIGAARYPEDRVIRELLEAPSSERISLTDIPADIGRGDPNGGIFAIGSGPLTVAPGAVAAAVSRKSDEQVGRAVRELGGVYAEFASMWNGVRSALSGLALPSFPPQIPAVPEDRAPTPEEMRQWDRIGAVWLTLAGGRLIDKRPAEMVREAGKALVDLMMPGEGAEERLWSQELSGRLAAVAGSPPVRSAV
jgi:hypothetical protein